MQATAQAGIENRGVQRTGELKALIDHGVITEDIRLHSQQQAADRAAGYFQRVNGEVAPGGVQTGLVRRQVMVVIEQ